MKRPFKKLTAWLCCMAMLISFIPATALPVFAAEALPTSGKILADAEYVLEDDHVLTGGITVTGGVDVTLDLAGHTISMPDADGTYFTVNEGATLTIQDSVGTGKIQFKNTAGGYGGINIYGNLVLEGGELNGWTRINNGTYGAGGMLNIWAGASFTMTGGKITGADCNGNTVLRTQGTGGGIDVTITGGEITGNNAKGSNIIYLAGTAADPNTLTIGGDAVVAGNTLNNAAYTAAGYEIQCKNTHVTVSGEATVGYLYDDGDTETEGVDGYPYSSMTFTGAPTVAGIRWSAGARTPTTIEKLTEGANIKTVNGATVFSKDATVATEAYGSAKPDMGTIYTYQAPVLPTSGTVGEADYVLTADHVLTNTLIIAAGTEVTIDLAGNTISMPDKDGQYFTINGKLTIKDSVGGGLVQFKTTTAGSPAIGIGNSSTEAVFVLEGGELNGWKRAGAGGAIYMYEGSTFIMTGGLITDCDATSFSVIRSAGGGQTLTITGGEITGNDSGGAIVGISTATAANPATVTIGGEAVIIDNTVNEAAYTAAAYELQFKNADVAIGENAVVGYVYNDGDVENADVSGYPYSSISITGAPIVSGVRWSAGARTPVSVTELEDGAEIKMLTSLGKSQMDETVAVSGPDAENKYTYSYKVPTYAVTVEQAAGGTVEVDVTEGAEGTTVTVTATADEGYELVDILVNGEAIQGNTFDIVAGDNVVTATFEAVAASLPTSGTVVAGEYTLAADHVLTNTLAVKDGAEVTIDLAGHTISMPDKDGAYFSVAANSTLTIKDSVGGGKVQMKATTSGSVGIAVTGTFNLEGGTLTGWSRSGAGGAVYLYAGSTFNMTGGAITGNTATGASAIRSVTNDGGITVNITGGEITGNETSGNIVDVRGIASNPSTVNIGGDAVIADNTIGGAAYTTSNHELQFYNVHLTVGDEAVVGYIYNNGDAETEDVDGYPYSSIAITGAPIVSSVRWSAGAKTPVTVKNLTDGAEIKMLADLSGSQIDDTVAKSLDGNVYTYAWQDPATIEYTVSVGAVAGGTVAVAPEAGVIGTEVTVTATADEGYELVAILVDGEAIDGTTFAITGDHVVTANFAAVDVSLPTSGQVASGEYVLEGDHVLTGTLVFQGETVIDLAGNTITADAGRCFFNIPANGHLTITDSVGGGVVEFLEMTSSGGISLTGTFTLEGGELTGWSRVENGALKAGGFIDMFANSTFEMTGGVITGMTAASYSVIRSHGAGVTVDITGGEIVGNESSNGAIIGVGKAGGQSWLNIGGEAVILENTMNGELLPFNYDAIVATETIVTIGDYAFVEANINASLGASEDAVALESSQIHITGTPYVKYLRADSSAKTLVTITELEDGAEIHTSYGFTVDAENKDASVAVEAWDAESGNANEKGNIYTWRDPASVVTYTVTVGEVSNGTVTVSPAQGEAGTTVTVTATAAEGYELTAILVDGEAIDGTTFAITGDHVVTATFAEKVVEPDPEPTGLPTSGTVASGTYVLTGEHKLTGRLNITGGSEVVIDLAGNTLTYDETFPEASSFFQLATINDKLTIRDSVGGGQIVGHATTSSTMITSYGDVTLEGGKLTGWDRTDNTGGALYMISGTFTMTGGEISGNAAKSGASSNSAIRFGNGTTFNMSGGTITGNNGAPAISAGLLTFNMTGGTIKDNLTSGAALTVGQFDVQVNHADAVVNISGGEIGHLYVVAGALNVSGATVINNLRMDAAAVTAIEDLEPGASINTQRSGVFDTVADDGTIFSMADGETDAVAAGTLYTYYDPALLGFADQFQPGATVTLTEDTSAGVGVVLTEAGTYTLDLAGYTLTGTAVPYFTLGEGVELIVNDSSENGTGKIVGIENAANAMILVNGGYFELNGGLLTGNVNANGMGGAIYAATAGSFVCINGGEISGNTARRGGAIAGPDTAAAIDVTVLITGGTVTGNATNRGATMYTQTGATVVIEGGKVGYGTINGEPAVINTSGAEDLWLRNSVVEIAGGDINGIYFNGNAENGYTLTVSGATTIKCLCGATAEVASVGSLEPGAEIILNGGALAVDENDDTVKAYGLNYYYPGDVQSILFVANSFGGDSTQYLNAVGSYFGKKIAPAYLYVGSQSIRNHAQSLAESLRNTDLNGDGIIGDSRQRAGDGLYTCGGFTGYVDIPTVMESTTWDYVVLQPGVEYVGFEGTYNSDIDFLMDYIADVQPGAQILWSQTWAVDNRSWSDQSDPDDPESAGAGEWLNTSSYLTQFGGSQEVMYDAILRNTDKFVAGADARFAFDDWFPIGIAVQTMRQNYTDSYLTRDGFHLSYNAGRMIAALTVFKTLYPDVDLSTMTAADMAGLFKDTSTNHLKDLFDPTEENVATLLAAVETACADKDTIVTTYGEGTANKQFNPDAAVMSSNEYVAVYENVTEVGQVPVRTDVLDKDKNVVTDNGILQTNILTDKYASTGAGKIVIYKNGAAVSEIDELWLEANAGIEMTNRYANLDGTYYIIADPQAPQLAVSGSKLYMTFTVMLYTDDGNIINGGVYFTTSTDGVTWTSAVKVSDAPMAYGLTALSNGNLLLSVADTTTKVLTLTAAGAVAATVELDDSVADVAFAEVDGTVWALTSNGAIYFSADKGATWTATGVTGGSYANPDLVPLAKKGAYVTWSDEAECKIYSKVWSIDKEDTATYGWNNTEGNVVAEYAVSTAYAGKSTGGQPATMVTSTSGGTHTKTYFVDGGELDSFTHGVVTSFGKNLVLESSLTINFKTSKSQVAGMLDEGEVATVKFLRHYADKDPVVTTIEVSDEYTDVANANNYAFPYPGIAAKEMGDSVYFAIYDADGNQITTLEKYSVLTYAKSQLSTSDTAWRTAVVDLLNYGASAQVYFEYDVTNLVNAGLTEEQKGWASEVLTLDASMEEGYVNPPARASKKLNLVSSVELMLQYTYMSGDYTEQVKNAAYATVSYTTWDGNPVEKRIELTEGTSGGGSKDIKLDFLATPDMGSLVTINLHYADDSVIEGTEMVYSVDIYCYNQMKKTGYNPDDSLHVMLMNLMLYGDSVYAYKNP
ncbi:MAG: DUF4886 domain-containing protein [Oscillospiraceae bacterium]|nr:DUF4886 domain-containing protein [Oscillospiraceae bacterium]